MSKKVILSVGLLIGALGNLMAGNTFGFPDTWQVFIAGYFIMGIS